MKMPSVESTTGTLIFDREQELTIVWSNAPGQGYRIDLSGATKGNGSAMGGPASPVFIDQSERVHILSGTNGAEECSDLRYLAFEPPF